MNFKTLVSQIVSVFQSLNLKQRIIIAISIFVVVAFLVFLSLYKSGSSTSYSGYGVLFDNVSPSDSALILQQLDQDGVPYKLANENTILVPSDKVYKQRIAVAALGIPKQSKVGFEIFDKQEFGATDFEQRVKYLRALEGELGRTIESLEPILKANVHIAIPKESVFVQDKVLPTASVVLNINPSLKINAKQILGIKNLVSASVMNLTSDNVKIVNQKGMPLGEDEGSFSDDLIKSQIRYQKDYEEDFQNKIKKALAPIVGGFDKVIANVTIDFDFAREDSTSEVYDPNSVPRSEQSVEEKKEGIRANNVGGVPGAVSNIGPVEGIKDDKVTEKYTKNTATTNYEISKKIINTKDAFASIKKISAAVVVDGRYNKDEEKNEFVYTPLSQDELEKIEQIVKQTIGFTQNRGDQVTVSNFEFKPLVNENQNKSPTEAFVLHAKDYVLPLWPVLKYLILFILLYVFYKKVILPFSKHMLEVTQNAKEEQEEDQYGFEDVGEDTLEQLQKAKKRVEDQLGVSDGFNEEELKYEVLLEKLRNIANERSDEVAQVLENMVGNETDYMRE